MLFTSHLDLVFQQFINSGRVEHKEAEKSGRGTKRKKERSREKKGKERIEKKDIVVEKSGRKKSNLLFVVTDYVQY